MTREDVNKETYEAQDTVELYCSGPIQLAELLVLIKYKDEYWNKRILDVGCGAGRTTEFMRNVSDDYTCMDYSLNMTERCKSRFPEVRCLHCDARDMSIFENGAFDFVLFSNNGLDCLSDEDRRKALREINRVLGHGGLFVFSSHNRNYKNAVSHPRMVFSPDPSRLLREFYRFLKRRGNHRRNMRYECREDGYWILNDRAHMYTLLTYYITQSAQAAQLRDSGFEALEAYGADGPPLALDGEDRESSWIYYVARKTGPPPE